MENIRVAILDTGIANEMVDDRIKLKVQIYYDYYDEKVVIDNIATDYNGHGTMCINTIWNRFPNVDIFVIKVLNIAGMTNNIVFKEALKYVEKLDVEIISVCASYIVKNVGKEIEKECNRIVNKGKWIVASVQNGEESSAIANYKNVIGVIGEMMDDMEFSYFEDADIQMRCNSEAAIVPGVRCNRNTFRGNSRATAIATATLAEILFKKKKNKQKTLDMLRNKADNQLIQRDVNEVLFENIIYEKFEVDRERFLIEHEKQYQRFIYLLCEFYMCENPNTIRQAYLLSYDNNRLVKCLEDLLQLIEERFNVYLINLKVADFQWAYLFYERYLK